MAGGTTNPIPRHERIARLAAVDGPPFRGSMMIRRARRPSAQGE